MKEASPHQQQTSAKQVSPASEPQASSMTQKKSALGTSPLVQRRKQSSESLQDSSRISQFSQQQEPMQKESHLDQSSTKSEFRTDLVVQRAEWKWSGGGASGVLLGEGANHHAVKFHGISQGAVQVQETGVELGLQTANMQLVNVRDNATVQDALFSKGWSKKGQHEVVDKALLMNKAPVKTLSDQEVGGAQAGQAYNQLGKMAVMDLIARNNDRLPLRKFLDEEPEAGDDGAITGDRIRIPGLKYNADRDEDSDGWYWKRNRGNIMHHDGNLYALDTDFTKAGDDGAEAAYADGVASLLTDHREALIEQLANQVPLHTATDVEGRKPGIRAGLEEAMTALGFPAVPPVPVGGDADGDADAVAPARNPAEFKRDIAAEVSSRRQAILGAETGETEGGTKKVSYLDWEEYVLKQSGEENLTDVYDPD